MWRRPHPVLLLAAALAVLPFLMPTLGLTTALATELALFAMAGLGFNLLLGYTGLVSFGHGAFFGLAAYSAALLQIHVINGGVVIPVLFGTLFAALCGLVVGFLILRRRGVYFSLLTLAFTAMIFYIVFRWTSFTGGENGLGGIKRGPLLGVDLDNQNIFYVAVSIIVLLVAGLMWRIVNSPFGRVLIAIRENEQRARFAGFPVQRYKLLGFIVSAAAVGLAGTLFGLLKYFISADLVHVTFSGEILAMTVIGGQRHFLGPALGALFFILFRELLTGYTASWQLWFGLLFMGFVLFSPGGLMGLGERMRAPFRKRREEAAAMAARVTPNPAAENSGFPARRRNAVRDCDRGSRDLQALRRLCRGRPGESSPAAARDPCAHRPERRRQDDVLQCAHRPVPSRRRLDPICGAKRCRSSRGHPGRPRSGTFIPDHQHLPSDLRAREPAPCRAGA